jgi:hypothetical protein
MVVVSQWRHDVCVATTPVSVSEIPGLIALLAGALADAAIGGRPSAEPPSALSLRRDAIALIKAWCRPGRAPVVALRPRAARHRSVVGG